MNNESLNYVNISLDKILPEMELPGDIYLSLNTKYICYKYAGDLIPSSKYNLFMMKKITNLFCKQVDLDKFLQWEKEVILKQKSALIRQVGIQNKDLVEARTAIKTEVFKLFTEPMTDEKCKKFQENTRRLVGDLISKPSSKTILKKLMVFNPNMADHAVNVATVAVYLAMNMGYNHQLILEHIYMGSLLHDFGKTQFDPKILEKSSDEEIELMMKKHPELGVEALLKMKGLAQEVLKIVAEHHEYFDGSGYPKGLRGSRIYELAKIVTIANEFETEASMHRGTMKEKQKFAISQLEKDSGFKFDPKKLEKCIAVLKLGI